MQPEPGIYWTAYTPPPSLFYQASALCLMAHLLNFRKIMFTKSLDAEPPPPSPLPPPPRFFPSLPFFFFFFFFCRLAHTSRINWEQVSRSEYCLSSQQFSPWSSSCVGEQNGMHIRVNAKKMELFYQLEVCFFFFFFKGSRCWLTFCSYRPLDDIW